MNKVVFSIFNALQKTYITLECESIIEVKIIIIQAEAFFFALSTCFHGFVINGSEWGQLLFMFFKSDAKVTTPFE